MATLSSWDSLNRNVQSGLAEGQFVAAQFTLVCAGPPNLAFLAGSELTYSEDSIGESNNALVFPIGVTQRLGIAQTKQHARVWEIGSTRSYWISGRTVGQITLGRIMYHGPNLLRSLFAYYSTEGSDDESRPEAKFPHLMGDSAYMNEANANRNPHSIRVSPGYKNVFLNLASDLFSQTIGLMIYLRDSNDESMAAYYAENCVVPTHSLGMDAGGTVMQENCQLQFERLVPIEITGAVELTDIDSSGKVSVAGGQVDRNTGRNF